MEQRVNQQAIYQNIIHLMDQSSVEYKLFKHRVALTYEDLAAVQKEAGFIGTEGKCLVLKADESLLVYITIQGQRVNFENIKQTLNVNKVRLAAPEELMENFGAEPGCAYPFGFDEKYPIYIDPRIYEQEWLLFSPLFPDQTVQAKGADLKKVYEKVGNKVTEVSNFNL